MVITYLTMERMKYLRDKRNGRRHWIVACLGTWLDICAQFDAMGKGDR